MWSSTYHLLYDGDWKYGSPCHGSLYTRYLQNGLMRSRNLTTYRLPLITECHSQSLSSASGCLHTSACLSQQHR